VSRRRSLGLGPHWLLGRVADFLSFTKLGLKIMQ
jgi:hypothetical protein